MGEDGGGQEGRLPPPGTRAFLLCVILLDSGLCPPPLYVHAGARHQLLPIGGCRRDLVEGGRGEGQLCGVGGGEGTEWGG